MRGFIQYPVLRICKRVYFPFLNLSPFTLAESVLSIHLSYTISKSEHTVTNLFFFLSFFSPLLVHHYRKKLSKNVSYILTFLKGTTSKSSKPTENVQRLRYIDYLCWDCQCIQHIDEATTQRWTSAESMHMSSVI